MWGAVAASCCFLLLYPWVFEILFGEDAADYLYTKIKCTYYQCTDLRGWPVNWAFIQSEPLWSFSQHHTWTIICRVTGICLHDPDHAPSVAWATSRNWHCFLPIFIFGMEEANGFPPLSLNFWKMRYHPWDPTLAFHLLNIRICHFLSCEKCLYACNYYQTKT